jgi:hypothetical protein
MCVLGWPTVSLFVTELIRNYNLISIVKKYIRARCGGTCL